MKDGPNFVAFSQYLNVNVSNSDCSIYFLMKSLRIIKVTLKIIWPRCECPWNWSLENTLKGFIFTKKDQNHFIEGRFKKIQSRTHNHMSQLFWNAIYEKSGRWHGPILYLWVRKKNHAVALWTWIDFFWLNFNLTSSMPR